MAQFIFATSNELKVSLAKHVCGGFNVNFNHRAIDLVEIQSEDAGEIALHKVRQAYEKFNEAVAVTDDSWLIPGLNGFPGPYMKYINQWFTPQDFINLTKDLEDRRIIMRHVIAYKDKDNEKVFTADIEAALLKEVHGKSVIPHFTVISFNGGKHSAAEAEGVGLMAISHKDNAWHQLCEWLRQT